MRQTAVRAASALLVASLLACPALAGDRAAFNPLGFSADGRVFAFEEFGIQDGSGFPYSNIYVIDLPTDRWVEGAPFRVRLDTDGAELAEARQRALALAGDALEALTQPAEIVALNGDAEPGDGQTLSFGLPRQGLNEPGNVRTLSLDTFAAVPAGLDCASFTDRETVALRVMLDDNEIYRDSALPASRGCVLDYGIYAVLEPFPQGVETPFSVAIISVYPFGFEGPDRRFIAIPIERP